MRTFFVSLIILYVILISPTALSQIPKVISYQGLLTDTAGNAKPDGKYNFTFRLYETNAGGSPVWTETKQIQVKKGLFSTNLGDQAIFKDNIKFERPYWLGIQIESETELPVRIMLTSAAYSISSINADTAQYAKQVKIDNGQLVKSINGLKDNITLKGSGGAAVTANGDTIIIAASGGGNGGGISAIQNTDNALSISNPNGPTATINLHSPFIINSKVGIGVNSPASKLDVNGGNGSGANIGIHGSSNDNYGIYGTSNSSFGLFGESAGSQGIHARTYNSSSYALLAEYSANGTNYCGLSSGKYAIFANGPAYIGGAMGIGTATPGSKLDVNGGSSNGAEIGIHGSSNDNYGIYGSSNTSFGVFGESGSSPGLRAKTYSGSSYALFADNGANSKVICALASGEYGVYATSDRFAGYFDGYVSINGALNVTGGKYFKIDHPLDPENKYLIHSCIESPDRMNIYNGNVTTDVNGTATVNLPSYFQALNIDYRYQLTVIGQFAQAIIENEISNNQFTIKTDKPNVKVSWQVTGIRNDVYAKANPMVVEKEKSPQDRGKYLAPELYGKPKEMGINYVKPFEINLNNKKKND